MNKENTDGSEDFQHVREGGRGVMRPLEGIRVVELATMLAGPMCARVLAEWGAEVIKVESVNGDAWRLQYGTSLSKYSPVSNPHYDVQNINKKFICINMRTEKGREVMEKLLDSADVLLTNYRVRALEGMELAYDQVKERFPRLIHASILGYGAKGPEKDRPGYDYTAFCSRTGFIGDLAPAGGPPLMTIAGVGDHTAAMNLAGAICAALYSREKTGEGQKVDASLLQAGLFMLSMGLLNAYNGRKLPRTRFDCAHATSNTYRCSDGEWIYLAVVDYRRFPEFCDVIGRPELKEDSRFAQEKFYSEKSRRELTEILDEVFAGHPSAYWHELLSRHDLPYEPVNHLRKIPTDPQVQANGYVIVHEYPDGIKGILTPGPACFSSYKTEDIPFVPSRQKGADTELVLEGLGYTRKEIKEMKEVRAVIGAGQRAEGESYE